MTEKLAVLQLQRHAFLCAEKVGLSVGSNFERSVESILLLRQDGYLS